MEITTTRNIGRTRVCKKGLRRSNSCAIQLMAIALPQDFKEFIQLLNLKQVRYLLIGGYAINLYGYSRNTEDLDFWVAIV